MTVVEEIKQKTDIVEVIGQYTPLTKSGKTFRGLCPFHSEKHGSFFVYPDQQSWHCFGACGTGGDVFSFIMKKDGISFGEALRLLAERSGVVIPQNAVAEKSREKHDRLYQANQAAADYYHQLLLTSPDALKVRDYLAKRGLNAESVENFKLGYSPNSWDSLEKHMVERGFSIEELLEAGLIGVSESKKRHDRFRHRLIFPITDIRGRVIGFGGRALDDAAQPKYLNSPQTPLFDKSSNLYGLSWAKEAMRSEGQAVIVEGYMDVILPHQYGFKNVIASMGTAIGENHIAILKKMTRGLVLALDPDSAGQEAMLRSVGLENSLGNEIRVAVLPEGKDPDEIVIEDPEAWRGFIKGAIPILDFAFDKGLAGLDLKSSKGKTDLVEALMPTVNQIKDVVRQTYYIDKLAALVGQSPKKLELLLAKNRRIQPSKTTMGEAQKASVSNPVEEYCLAVILKNPPLKEQCGELLPEYFDSSENREVYNVIKGCEDLSQVRASLDPALLEHFDRLIGRELVASKMEAKLADAVLRLREEHLKRLAQNRADTLAVDEGNQLRELFVKKEHLGEEKEETEVSPKKKVVKPVEDEEADIKVAAKEAGDEAEEETEEEALKAEIDEEELPTKEALEEVEVPPADLSIPIEQFEEPGVVDDPVRMYLHEIGRVPLLTADDEKSLAQKMEKGKRVDEIREFLRKKMGRDPSTTEIMQHMLKEIGQAAPLVHALQKELGLKHSTGFKKAVFAPQIRQAIDNEINQNLTMALAAALNRQVSEIEQIIINLSLNSSLLPKEVIDQIDAEEVLDGVEKLAEDDKFIKAIQAHEKKFTHYLEVMKAEAAKAQKHLIEANLRLVVSVAKKHIGRGMPLLDLLQEGNIGLIRAVEKFDYHRGFKFSTYATWWIRQAITRAIADQARTIRIPVHMVETINKLLSVSRQLSQEHGREPTPKEIGDLMEMSPDRVREIIKVSQLPISLESPIGEEEDSHLGDFIEDQNAMAPPDAASRQLLKEQIDGVLSSLTPRERRVLQLRFGLEDGRSRTLEEVGKEFNVTRERIRQIEAKALRKLRHPTRSRKLKDYLE